MYENTPNVCTKFIRDRKKEGNRSPYRAYFRSPFFFRTPPAAGQQPASVVNVWHIRDGKVTLVSSEIVYGKSPNYFMDNGDFLLSPF